MKTKVEKHFDKVAKDYDFYKTKNEFYYKNLKKLLGSLILGNKKVFEIGCGTGDLLASLNPKYGYGMDISDQMVRISKFKYQKSKNLAFSMKWPNETFDYIFTPKGERYDYIFMSDVIEHLEDPGETFKKVCESMDRKSKFVITMANPIWEPFLMTAEKLNLKMSEGPHRRIRYKDIKILNENAGMKIIKHDYKLLMPISIPVITDFVNKYLEKYFRRLAFIEYFVVVKS